MEVDDVEPAAGAGVVPPRWPWHRVAGRISFGISSAASRRSLVTGGVALFAVGGLLWAAGLTGLWPIPDRIGVGGMPQWSHLLTLALAVLAVLLFRSQPVVALGLGATAGLADAAIGGSVGVLVAMWELLFCVGVLGSRRVRRVVTGAVTVVVVAGSVDSYIAESDLSPAFVTGIQLLAVLALPLWWAATVRQKSELADLAAQRADLEAERADLQTRRAADLERIGELRRTEAVQAERSEIARDLHDAIASRLSTIAIHSAVMLAGPGRGQDDAVRTVRAQALEALQEMRSMIVVLRSESGRASTPHAPVLVDGPAQSTELVGATRADGPRVPLDLPAGWADLAAHASVAADGSVVQVVVEPEAVAADMWHAVARLPLPGGEERGGLS